MSQFQFKQQANHVQKLCKESLCLLSSRKEEEIKRLSTEFKTFWDEYGKEVKLTVAFIGQYNAGKSSIIAAITGAKFNRKYSETVDGEQRLVEVYQIGEKEIKIGAQIMTDNADDYPWEEVVFVDTPGIHAGRKEHDNITLDRITKSDLLVFVITGELFNPESGIFFREIVKKMQRKGQMMLVVNKMSREPGSPENLLKSVLPVIEPDHPDDFYTCFIDANSYLKAQQEKDEDEKQFFIQESHLSEFLGPIHKLIDRNKLSARLTTPLHRSIDMLEQSLNFLSTEDEGSRDLLEILRRKTLKFRASLTRFRNDYHTELYRLEYEVATRIGEGVAGKVNGQHNVEEINASVKEAEVEIGLISDETHKKLNEILTNELNRLQTELEELKQSPLGQKLTDEFGVGKSSRKNIGDVSGIDGKSSDSLKSIVNTTKNLAPQILSKLSKFTGNLSKETVKGTLKFFKGKLKPWEAVKTTRFINGTVTRSLQGAIPIIGALLSFMDIVLTAKEEKEKKNYEKKLLESRTELRQGFRKVALEMRNELEDSIKEIEIFYNEELNNIENEQQRIRALEESKNELTSRIECKMKEIKEYIKSIG